MTPTPPPSSAVEPEIHKGLAGVVVDTTEISRVDPDTNSLIYRGYPVQDLAAHCSFEQVAYLLWNGELPTDSQLAAFREQEAAARALPPELLTLLVGLPADCHPMDVVRTLVSVLGADDPAEDDPSESANRAKALRLLAVLPTVVAADLRRRRGLTPVAPDPGLGYAENYLRMCFGEAPDPVIAAAFDQSMILYAEHGFNASTFTARVVTSTRSDIYSSVTAAVGTLKGSLHGGANEAVMRALLEIDQPENVDEWLRGKLSHKEKVMGFGHRVYKHGDSRVPTMKTALDRVAEARDGKRWVDVYEKLEAAMFEATGIKPNVDYPTGVAYYLMGFDLGMFTPMFVMARVVGWTTHVMEQTASNALIRPLSIYTGRPPRELPIG